MKPTIPGTWHHLFNGAFNDTLTPGESEQLAGLLATEPEARQLWYIYCDNECSLSEIQRVAVPAPFPVTAQEPAVLSWLRSRTLRAAASGLILGLLCASVGWAVAVPGFLSAKTHPLPLVDSSFEVGPPPQTEGIPRQFGVWSGDFSTVSTGERGVTPVDGRQMLRFLRADNENSPPGLERDAAEVWQAIDMTPFQKKQPHAPIVVELSAQFNLSEAPGAERSAFGVALAAFSGEISQLPELWRTRQQSALVRSGREQPAEHNPGAWQTATTQLSVPQDANILLVQVYALRRSKASLPQEFNGHFVDGVSLRLLEIAPQSITFKRSSFSL